MALLTTQMIIKYDAADGAATALIIKYDAADDGNLDVYNATADHKI